MLPNFSGRKSPSLILYISQHSCDILGSLLSLLLARFQRFTLPPTAEYIEK